MKKIIFLFFLTAFITYSGCKKKDKVVPVTPTVTSVAEDKQNITAAFTQLSTCLTQIRDGEGAQAIFNFMKLNNGTAENEDWARNIVSELENVLDLNSIDNSNQFDFNANKGVYTWDQTNEIWNKTSSSNIVLIFPSTDGAANNSELTISSYTHQALTVDGVTYYPPTAITANLLVNGVEVFSVNATAAYDAQIPTNITATIKLKPYTYTITGNRVTPTKFLASVNVSNGSGCATSGSLEFEFTHSDYPTLNLETDLKSVVVTVSHNNLNIVSVIDALTLSGIDDPTEAQVNQYVKTNVYVNNEKVGELQFYENATTETHVKIIYKDGTEEDTEVYYKPFINSLELIIAPYGGDVNII